jgi:DNA-directed RNA polymerase specialized sigma subunit
MVGVGDPICRRTAALQQVEPRFDLVEHRESLGSLLNALPERERTILLLRFGPASVSPRESDDLPR